MAPPRIGSTIKVTVYASQADYSQLKDGQVVDTRRADLRDRHQAHEERL